MVHKHTSVDFIKIHLMVHYEEWVQRFGHLVNDSTATQKWTIQRCVWACIASQFATFTMTGRFSTSTLTSKHSGCGASTSGSWLWKATGPLKSRRHFSYINLMIKLLSTNATMTKCRYHRTDPYASPWMREISKSVGCAPPDERASLSRTSVFQRTTFHLETT